MIAKTLLHSTAGDGAGAEDEDFFRTLEGFGDGVVVFAGEVRWIGGRGGAPGVS